MTPPDTREQARATAHRLLGPAACRCVGERHDFVCDRLTDYILARDAAHAAIVADMGEQVARELRAGDLLRAEVATLTARVKLHIDGHQGAEREIKRLRSRLSTVERERDEARADLQAEANCLGETRDLLINLANGDDVMDDVRAWLRRPEGLAYLSRSPVEGGRE